MKREVTNSICYVLEELLLSALRDSRPMRYPSLGSIDWRHQSAENRASEGDGAHFRRFPAEAIARGG